MLGVGEALLTLSAAFTHLPDAEQAALLEKAKVWARTHIPEREVAGRSVSAEAIAERFGLAR